MVPLVRVPLAVRDLKSDGQIGACILYLPFDFKGEKYRE